MKVSLHENIERWERELNRIQINYRWGETRRFHSDTRKIERRNWLIDRIGTAREKLRKANEIPNAQS